MPRRKTPVYKQAISVDQSGRVRLGGRFASKKQVQYVTRKRRAAGLPTTLPKAPAKSKAKEHLSKTARKAALTRRMKAEGVEFVSEWRNKKMGFTFRRYRLPSYDPELIRLASERERLEWEGKPLALWPQIDVVMADDGEENYVSQGKGFLRKADDESANDVSDDFVRLENKYEIAAVVDRFLIFTPGR